jgi:hypothetical protein
VPEVVDVPPAPEPPVPEVPLAPLPPEPVVPPVPVFVPDLLVLSPQPAKTKAEMHTNAKSFFIAKLLEGKPIDHGAIVVCKKYSRAEGDELLGRRNGLACCNSREVRTALNLSYN